MNVYDGYIDLTSRVSSANKQAAWIDVKRKGRRLLAEGRYTVLKSSSYAILAEVVGDHNTYMVYVNNNLRVDLYQNNEITYWDCTCPWSEWAWSRETYTGRICSHVYAMHLLLQRNRRKKGHVMDEESLEETKLSLAANAVNAVVAESPEEYLSYVKDGVSSDGVTNSLVEIAVDFSLPVNVLDDLVVNGVRNILQNQMQQIDNELSAVEQQLEEQIARLSLELNDLEKKDTPKEIALQIIESVGEDGIDALIENPQEVLASMGITLEEDFLDVYEEILSLVMPENEPETVETQEKTASHGFKKRAGRVFTDEERKALIDELGISRQFLAGEIRF